MTAATKAGGRVIGSSSSLLSFAQTVAPKRHRRHLPAAGVGVAETAARGCR